MTANDQRRYTWQQVRKYKEQVSTVVYGLAKAAKIPQLGPSIVSCCWFAPDRRRRDADSLGPFIKAALDGLVKAGVWEDDHSDFVTEVRLSINKTQVKHPRLEILILERSASDSIGEQPA